MALAIAAALVSLHGEIARAQGEVEMWSRDLRFSHPLAPLLTDLDADGGLDVFVADLQGDLLAIDGSTGDPLWRARVDGANLKEGAAAALGADVAFDLFLPDERGRLHVIDGASGGLVQTLELGMEVTSRPTVADLDGDGRDEVVIVGANPSQMLILTGEAQGNGAHVRHTVPLVTSSGFGPSIGDVTGDGLDDIVVSDRVGSLAVLTGEGTRLFGWSGRAALASTITLADVYGGAAGGGWCEIIFADNAGQLVILGYQESVDGAGPGLVALSNGLIGEAGTMFGVLSAVGEAGSGVVIATTPRRVLAMDGLTRQEVWGESLLRAPATTTSVAATGPRSAIVVQGNADGALEVHRFDESGGERGLSVSLGGRLTGAPLLADLDGSGDLDAVILVDRRGRVSATAVRLGVECAVGDFHWVSPSGNPANAGHWLPGQRERLATAIQAAADRVQSMAVLASQALQGGETEQARTLAEQALAVSPSNALALDVLAEVTAPERRRRMLVYVTTGIAILIAAGFGHRAISRGRRVRRQIQEARAAGRWAEVIRLLAPIVKSKPGDAETRLALAEAYGALGRFDPESKPLLQELAAARPTPENRWALARCLLALGDESDGAIRLFAEMAKAHPEDPDLLRVTGRALMARGRAQEALPHLREFVRGHPDDQRMGSLLVEAQVAVGRLDGDFVRTAAAEVRLGRASATVSEALCRAAVEQGLTAEAGVGTAAEMVLASKPHDPWALLCRASGLIARQAWDEVTAVERLLPPGSPAEPHALTVRVLAAASRGEGGIDESLGRLLRSTPPPAGPVVVRLASLLAEQGRRDDLMQACGVLALAQRDCPAVVLEALAECLERSGRAEERAEILGRLAQREPESQSRWLAFGLACARNRRSDQMAREAYRRLLDDPPTQADDLRALLLACASSGLNDPRVNELAEDLAERHPDDPVMGLVVIRMLLDQGSAAEAHRRACEIERAMPAPDLQSRELLARAAFEAKDYERAATHYHRLREADPQSLVWRRHLSIALSRLGKHDPETIALHREVARESTGDAVAQIILARALLESGQISDGLAEVRQTVRSHPELVPQITKLLSRLLDTLPGESADRVRLLLADLLTDQGDLAEAASQLTVIRQVSREETLPLMQKVERAATTGQSNLDAIQALGLLLLHRGELTRAREVCERGLQIDPKSTDLIETLLRCEEEIVRQHDTAENRLRLGQRYLDVSRHDDALRVLQPIQDDVFLFRPVRMALTRAYLEKRMPDLAWQSMHGVPLDDASKPLHYQLGELFLEAGQPDKALEAWKNLYGADIGFRDIRTRYEELVEQVRTQVFATANLTSAAALASIGDHLFRERFNLEEEVGVGGMGRVYRAHDKTLDETVALKILPPELAANEEIVERLKREVRAARQLTHPHIIRIHDFGALGGQRFISMEFVNGPTLRTHIKGAPGLRPDQKLRFARQMAEALAYAHRRGIVHRDIKPANILIHPEDEVKITDFGIAKVLTGRLADATLTNQIVGTPLYMAPEQIRGDEVDGRADIYAFGITLYEMLMGRPPFTEGNLAYQHLTAAPPPLTGVSPRLGRLVEKCLEKQLSERWARFEDVLDELSGMTASDTAFAASP